MRFSLAVTGVGVAGRFLQPPIAAHRHHAVDRQEAGATAGQDVPAVRRDEEGQRGIHVSGKGNPQGKPLSRDGWPD